METATTPSTTAIAEAESCAAMFAKPQKEHDWLQKLAGTWSYESECLADPSQASRKFRGSEAVKSLGGLWIVCEGRGEMPDGNIGQMMLTLGFDPTRNRFVGTWVGSMMTHLWVYEGQLDATGRILTLNAEGPSFTDSNQRAKYQDIIEIKSDDHRTLSSRCLGEDGKWTHFMTAHYRRTA